jgi:hypothetical protein
MKVPLIVKGIVTQEDAKLCVERGVDGIIVSNHGGRSMDYGPATLEALPEIVAAVNGRIPVMIDSGFRRGSDVLKALALGADAGVPRTSVAVGAWRVRAGWSAAAAQRDHLQGAGRGHGSHGPHHAGFDRREHHQAELALAEGGVRERVGTIERQWQQSISRRKALASLAGLVAGSPLLHAQLDPRHINQHRRTPGLAEMFSSFDFEPVMFANVPQSIYDYTAHGEGGESNLRRNRQAFDWVDLVPGRAVDPATVDLSTEILGIKMKYPIMIAPTGRRCRCILTAKRACIARRRCRRARRCA